MPHFEMFFSCLQIGKLFQHSDKYRNLMGSFLKKVGFITKYCQEAMDLSWLTTQTPRWFLAAQPFHLVQPGDDE